MGGDSLRKNFPFFLVLLFLSLFFFLADNFGWLRGIRGMVQRPFLGLTQPVYWWSQSVGKGKESDQVVALQTQLRQLAVDQNQLSTCLAENEEMRRLLGSPLPGEWQFKLARVVGLTEQMRLALGADEGVKDGMMVVSENIYVGQVVSVGEGDSLVELPTDLDSRIPVVVKKPGSSGIQARGLLIGQPGEKLVLDRVLQEEDVQQADLVVTSGEEGFLADLVIGTIEEVKKGTAEVYQQALISPLIDYRSLRLVFVVFP